MFDEIETEFDFTSGRVVMPSDSRPVPIARDNEDNNSLPSEDDSVSGEDDNSVSGEDDNSVSVTTTNASLITADEGALIPSPIAMTTLSSEDTCGADIPVVCSSFSCRDCIFCGQSR